MAPPVVAEAPGGWGPAMVVAAADVVEDDGEGPYLLDSGDQLRIFVYGHPNLSRLYTVDQSGMVSVPLIGDVPARGRTTRASAAPSPRAWAPSTSRTPR